MQINARIAHDTCREVRSMQRRLIITVMRNEAPFILEWLVYHRLIGFTDFLVFSNDCDDGTDEILNRLQALGLLTHRNNKRGGKKTVQWQALSRAWNADLVKSAEWILVSDVDEFLVIHPGEGHLDDLFAARPDADGFVLSWRMFGNAGLLSRSPGLVMENFPLAAPEALIWPWLAVQCKTLFRKTKAVQKLGVHLPRMRNDAMASFVDDNGNPLRHLNGTLLLHSEPRYQLAQINHYALGSMEDFLLKADRGKPNHTSDAIGLDYWMDRNFNHVEDKRIQRHAEAVRSGVAELMADPVLAELHDKALHWRQQRLAHLLLDPDNFYLYSRIQQSGSTRVLPMPQQLALLQKLFRALRNKNAAAQNTEQP